MDGIWETSLLFLKERQWLCLPLAFGIAMAESIIGISLFIPSTLILIGVSSVLSANGVELVPLWIAAGLGANIGDWISYGIGYFFEHKLHDKWPIKDNRELYLKGHAFFEKWGWLSLFLSRFLGPVRSITPLIAGVCEMPLVPFAIASFLSAFLWAAVVLLPGGLGGGMFAG